MWISIISKIITSVTISFDAAFKSPQNEASALYILLIILLEVIEKKSVTLKKVILFIILELINCIFKYFSVYIFQGEIILLCTASTIMTISFQTSIFQNEYLTIIIIIKHLWIWYFHDERHQHQKNDLLFAVIISIAIIYLSTFYEIISELQ